MRVLIAPDSFTGTLSAVQAAQAIAAGWARAAPRDELDPAPVSDGGPGFVAVLATSLGGVLLPVTVEDPLGRPVDAQLLLHERTAYVESAQACGLHLLAPGERDLSRTSTYGVGQLISAAVGAGVQRIVVGLGGSGTNDGGAGAVAALEGLAAGRHRLGGVELLVATDVDNPLLGPDGATAVFARQKGARPDQLDRLEEAVAGWAASVGSEYADRPGAGAAGGLGFGLLALGARRVAGIATVLAAARLDARAARADLALTGEGSFDAQTLRGKAVAGVAGVAAGHELPCLVLAGRIEIGHQEMAAAGVTAAYALPAGAIDPMAALTALAAQIAADWSARWR